MLMIMLPDAVLPVGRHDEVKAAIEELSGASYPSAKVALTFLGFELEESEGLEEHGDGDLIFSKVESEQDDDEHEEFLEAVEFIARFLKDGSEFLLHCFIDYDVVFRKFVVSGEQVKEYSGHLEWEEEEESEEEVLSRGYF